MPQFELVSDFKMTGDQIKESHKEAKPLFFYPSPSPLKERETKGVR